MEVCRKNETSIGCPQPEDTEVDDDGSDDAFDDEDPNDPTSAYSDVECEETVVQFNLSAEGETTSAERVCFVCKKEFSTQNTLSRHMKTQHQMKVMSTNRLLNCPVEECTQNFNFIRNLREHLYMDHCIQIEDKKILKFKDFKEFLDWKCTEERIAHSKYRKQTGKRRRLDDVEVHEFICNGIGKQNRETRNKQKSRGIKINAVCPSTIAAHKYPCGYVEVRYFQTHVGHSSEYEQLRLGRQERAEIDHLVAENATLNDIFDKVRNSRNGEFDRLQSVVDVDVRKAQIVYKLLEERPIEDRRSDYEALVAELRSVEHVNPFLEVPMVPFHSEVGGSLFVLAMNQFQSEMLASHGNGSTVCVDVVKCKVAEGLKIISIYVIPNSRAAFLAAFCLHSFSDQKQVFVKFLKGIKRKIGTLSASVLMVNEDFMFQCWKDIIGPPQQPNKVLPPWEVDRSWRRSLSRGKGRLTKQAGSYKALRCLQTEMDKVTFKNLYDSFTQYSMSRDRALTKRFKPYRNTIRQWAYCCQDTNFAARSLLFETINLTLDCILGDTRAINYDILLNILLRFVRDSTIRYVDVSSLMETISMHHEASFLLDLNEVEELCTNKWKVKSSSGERKSVHIVQRIGESCIEDGSCSLRCLECNACVHNFVCSCIVVLCKHVHLVAMLQRRVPAPPCPSTNVVIYTEDGGDISAETLATILSDESFASRFTMNELVSDITAYCQRIVSNVVTVSDLQQLSRLRDAVKWTFEISEERASF